MKGWFVFLLIAAIVIFAIAISYRDIDKHADKATQSAPIANPVQPVPSQSNN